MTAPPDRPLLPADETAFVIGLMSGTSADGVDAVACRLRRPTEDDPLEWGILGTAFQPYPAGLAQRLRRSDRLGVGEVAALDFEIGERFAEAAVAAARAAGQPLADFCLIGSHGQTLWHDPRGELAQPGATLQVGQSAVIAERTGVPVWSDFRVADVAAGGEGAPLVPYVDRLLFARPEAWTVCLNLGGIANATLLPPAASPEEVVAFDTGPANMVLDELAGRLLGAAHDEGGSRAASGRPSEARVEAALADPYFALPPPKSTGRERFGTTWVERHFGPLEGLGDDEIGERLASAAKVTVESVATAIEGACGGLAAPANAEVIVAGGGRRNRALMEGLARRLAPWPVVAVDERGLDGDFKEALAFAVLAYESALGRPVNLPSVTGARHPVRCGKLAFPPPAGPARGPARR